jgi:hypothetical protein
MSRTGQREERVALARPSTLELDEVVPVPACGTERPASRAAPSHAGPPRPRGRHRRSEPGTDRGAGLGAARQQSGGRRPTPHCPSTTASIKRVPMLAPSMPFLVPRLRCASTGRPAPKFVRGHGRLVRTLSARPTSFFKSYVSAGCQHIADLLVASHLGEAIIRLPLSISRLTTASAQAKKKAPSPGSKEKDARCGRAVKERGDEDARGSGRKAHQPTIEAASAR